MKTIEELNDKLMEKMREIDPDLDLVEGSVCYDLISPLAYIMSGFYQTLEDIQEKMDITKTPYEILKLWAIPRIGDLQKGTKTEITMEGEDLNHRTWILKKDNSYSFTKTEDNKATSEKTGFIDIAIRDILITPEDGRVTATIKSISRYGKEEETIEHYRTRYIQSLLVDSQAGLGTYYENKISTHEKVGTCGIDYAMSKNQNVVVCVVNTNYEKMTAEEMEEIKQYYTETMNIIPIGQNLGLETIDSMNITVKIQMKDKIKELEERIVLSILENYRKDTIIPELLRSRSLTYNINNTRLRNELITQLVIYGNVFILYLNNSTEDIILNKSSPKWEAITIEWI